MKTLTIKQPWASLIAHGIKDIENRSWKTNYRGRILIHAGAIQVKTKNISFPSNDVWFQNVPKEVRKQAFFNENIVSAIIGEVDIVDCVINHDSIWAEQMEYYKCEDSGLNVLCKGQKYVWNWVLANPVLYKEPILNVKGKLSFWEFEKGDLG
jgi:hypothetical protein